ncbi:BON domain-containing protein [Chitinophaga vietnamensis]|uniref:BON domain-containing protein n=1 Tax=Chitinophaga vietnamensis TaxID=2593957 RepID=UPI001177694E|nr:BON domain-containing protein [Chitinophaga vietnamensis]
MNTDKNIMAAAGRALKAYATLPSDHIHIVVIDGWLTLGGEVNCEQEREMAEAAVKDLAGVKGVTNFIHVTKDIINI